MSKPDGVVVLATGTGVGEEETPPPRVEAVPDGEKTEKPLASQEIVIEEISIDGMCGVY